MKALKELCPFMIGVAINEYQTKTHCDLILREFESVTCDNSLKLNYRIKEDGSYDFTEADYLYHFAISNNLKLRGHVIAWHIDFPEHIFGKMSRDELLNELRRYMHTVAKRYPLIYAWDIVNEAISGESDEPLKETPFYKIIGNDYIEQLFKIAREELGATVDLYLNEDDEWRMKKPQNILSYAKTLVEKGVPVDGIGLQCHISPYENLTEYRTLFDGIRALKLKCQITEMEVSVYDYNSGYFDTCPQGSYELQADTYKYLFRLFLEYSDIINLVNFWSLSDKETWRDNWPVENRKDWPTLFDENDEPKPVYGELVNMIQETL